MRVRLGIVVLAAVALASCGSQPVENPSSAAPERASSVGSPTGNPFPRRGPALEAIRQILPGLESERVRAMLGPPDSTTQRPPLTVGERLNALAVVNSLPGDLPPLSPGGDDWAYDRWWQGQADGQPIDVSQRITVSFDNAHKVEDCRVDETRLRLDKTGIVYLPSRDPRFNDVAAGGEIRCAALRE